MRRCFTGRPARRRRSFGTLRAEDPWEGAQLAVLGLVVHGMAGALALVSGIPYRLVLAVVSVGSALILFRRRIFLPALLPTLRYFYLYYLIALAAAVTVAFPIPGAWSGDWFENYQLGHAVELGYLDHELAGRTVLFGAASLPLTQAADGLCALQIVGAIAAAAVAAMVRGMLRRWRVEPRRANWITLLFCLSGLFLQHAGFPWPKMLACGCVLAAFEEAREAKDGFWKSAFWLAAAVAVHQAAILFIPAVWCAAWMSARPMTVRALGAQVLTLAIAGLVLVAPYEFWTISQFGLEEKVGRNPAVHFRKPGVTLAQSALENLETTFVPEAQPLVAPFSEPGFPKSIVGLGMRGFFALIAYTTAVAGTLVLALAPFLFLGRDFFRRLRQRVASASRAEMAFFASLILAIAGNAVLAAYASPVGVLQAGLTPLGVGAFVFLASSASDDLRTRRRATGAVLLLQTIPWVLLQGAALAGAATSERTGPAGLWQRLLAWDWDFAKAIETFGGTLGLRIFPFQWLVYAILSVGCWRHLRQTARPSLHPCEP